MLTSLSIIITFLLQSGMHLKSFKISPNKSNLKVQALWFSLMVFNIGDAFGKGILPGLQAKLHKKLFDQLERSVDDGIRLTHLQTHGFHSV